MSFKKTLCLLLMVMGSSTIAARDLADIYYLPTGNSITEGGRTYLENPKISLELPVGWKVLHQPDDGITLSLKDKTQKVRFGGETYRVQPSFNIRTLHKSEPIDEIRAKSFNENLFKFFTEKAPVDDFEIIQSERVDFHGVQDALLVYSTYSFGGLPMIQLHFLVASENEQYLMTYTDSEPSFRESSAKQDFAWQLATSIDYEGRPNSRYGKILRSGGVFLIALLFILMLRIKRHLKQRQLLKSIDADDDESMGDYSFGIEHTPDPIKDYDEQIDDFDDGIDPPVGAPQRKNLIIEENSVYDFSDVDDLEDFSETEDESEDNDDGWVV